MDIVALGVAILDMFPSQYGVKLADVPFFRPAPGGAMANVAVAAARLGARAAFIGKVGEDIFGRHIAAVLREAGVDISAMRFDSTACTTMNLHARPDDKTTEYCFYRKPGADTLLRADELPPALLQSAKILHFDSLNLTHEPQAGATAAAIKAVRSQGGIISFDVNYREPVWNSLAQAREKISNVLPQADIVKLNDDELELLTGGRDCAGGLGALLRMGPRLCVLTLGGDGSMAATANCQVMQPAFPVTVADAIGCGDGFIAGFLTRFCRLFTGWENLDEKILKECSRFAAAVGALTATKTGAIPALPALEEVEAFLAGASAPQERLT
ncbi:MAG: PfkB family carbohydrate kinase [Chitinivibrionales bacterium]|nr:PfkB family carbohydrate kinase [Chitinivibrionales bacterium]